MTQLDGYLQEYCKKWFNLRNNPFSTGALKEKKEMDRFVEFEDFHRIRLFLDQTMDTDCNLVVTGEKGIGKTSLLHWIEKEVENNRLAIFSRVRKKQSNKDFFVDLLEEIFRKTPTEPLKKIKEEDKRKIEEIVKRLFLEKCRESEETRKIVIDETLKGILVAISGKYEKTVEEISRISPKSYEENISQLFRDFYDIIKILTSNFEKRILMCIDEGHYLFREGMEIDKDLFDQSNCSFVLAGYPTMLQRINKYFGSGFYVQTEILFSEIRIKELLQKRAKK